MRLLAAHFEDGVESGMGPGRIAASAVIVGAAVMLGACVSQPPAPASEVSPAIAAAPPQSQSPAANWQWSDAGPAVILNATDITSAGAPAASLSLICDNAVPSVVVAWDSPLASAGQSSLTYRFDGQPGHDVRAVPAGPLTQIVSDPVVVSRFIDEAASGRQLIVRAGAEQASFSTSDNSGNLGRFRTACPSGMN